VKEDGEGRRLFGFFLVCEGRRFDFYADSEAERSMWIKSISDAAAADATAHDTDESRAAMEEMLLEIARQHAVQIDAEGPQSTLGTHHFWAIEARMRKLEELALAENMVGQTLIEQLRQELENERSARVAAEMHISGLQERLYQALHEVEFWAGCAPHISGIPQPKSHMECAKHLTKVEGSQIDGDATGHINSKLSDITRQPLHCTPPSPRLQYARRKGSALPTNWLDGHHDSQIGKCPFLGLIPGPAQHVAQVTADGELLEPPHPPTNCIPVRLPGLPLLLELPPKTLDKSGSVSQAQPRSPRGAFATPWKEEKGDGEAEAVPPNRIPDGPTKRPMGRIATTQHYNSFYANQPLVLP
jgi:hypothetical protein